MISWLLSNEISVITALGGSLGVCLDLFLCFFLCLLVCFTLDLLVGVVWNCSFILHSHLLCSTNGNSMSSCFMKEVLISSIVRVCVREATHSQPSSTQQPPHRRNDTHDGRNRWCVSSGNSRQTSTSMSRGAQPLREYTSSHRRTRPSSALGASGGFKCTTLPWDVCILESSRN